ncbi:hypothetical protein APSETT444_003596 [Aspergillus pseudonomiae]
MTDVFNRGPEVYGSNIGLNEKTAELIPDEKVSDIRKGSICAFIAWVTYICMVWAFKGVLVFLYNRLTNDLAIMCVPIPLILHAQIPFSQKIVLVALFSSGIFVMICAVLRAYLSVRDINHLSTALGWASREGFVSAFIVCAPGIKPLFTRIGWFKSYGSSNNNGNNYASTHKSRTSRFSHQSREFNTLISTSEAHPYEMSSRAWVGRRRDSTGESQEHIIEAMPHKPGDGPEHGIVVTTNVTLAHEVCPPRMQSPEPRKA